MAQTCHLHGRPLRPPLDHQARLDPTILRIRPPIPTFQKGRSTRSTYLRRLCGETSIIMPKKTRRLRLRRILDRTGLHHPLIRPAQVGYDHDRPFQMLKVNITLLLCVPRVPIHPLVSTPLIPSPRLPKPIFPRSTENGVAFWAPVQVVLYGLLRPATKTVAIYLP